MLTCVLVMAVLRRVVAVLEASMTYWYELRTYYELEQDAAAGAGSPTPTMPGGFN